MVERVTKLASQRAVVIFGVSNCCMCHAVKTLFTELGVSWTVHKLAKDPWGKYVERALAGMVMTLHLGGQIVPLLSQAGALWL